MFRDFRVKTFWKEPQSYKLLRGTPRLSHSNAWDWVVDDWGEYFKGRELHFGYRLATAFFYAIKGALDFQGKWFISWILSEEWNKAKSARDRGLHWLVADYALRWDDPSLLEEHKALFIVSEMQLIGLMAHKSKKPVVDKWFADEGYVIESNGLQCRKRKREDDVDEDAANPRTLKRAHVEPPA